MTAPAAAAWDDGLPPDQRAAASHVGSHARLLAGPGTGKTWTITKRVLFLVQDREVEPRRVVALTFTRAAAHELRGRVQDALAGKFADYPTVTTLHSYALRNLLHNSQRLDALPQPLRIADDWEERHIIQEDLKDLIHADLETVRDLLRALSADWDTLDADGEPQKRKADPTFVGAWQEHRGIYGYTLRAELVYQLKRALEQRKDMELVPVADYLLVDEFQDLNTCDLAVIQAIRLRGAEVYGAGDDDQSIYGFRHANTDGIRGFLEDFAPAGDLKLEVCHRCDKAIIDVAKFVAKLDPHALEKPLTPRNGAGEGEVLLLRFDNQYDEANAIASLCRFLIDAERHQPDDILVLLRSDRNRVFSKPLKDAIEAAGVSVHLNVSPETPLDTDLGRTVLALLRLCQSAADSLAWRTLLQVRKNGLGGGAIRAIYDVCRSNGLTFVQAIAVCDTDPATVPRFGNRIKGEREAILGQLQAICGVVTPTLREGQVPPPLNDRLAQALVVVIPDETTRSEIFEYLKATVEESAASNLEELLQAMSASEAAPEGGITLGAVNILTMHRAKGLSAKTVVIMAAEDEYIPGRQSGAAMDDERRLLYVSLTRARERLVVTYTDKRTGSQRHTGRTSGKTVRTLTRYMRDGPLKARDGNSYVRDLGR